MSSGVPTSWDEIQGFSYGFSHGTCARDTEDDLVDMTDEELEGLVPEPSLKGYYVAVPEGVAPPVRVPANTVRAFFDAISDACAAPLD